MTVRDFASKGSQFTINGRTTFLRGKHNACVFPLTGHPPTDVDGWLSYFRTCQTYGINHVRFHSWSSLEAEGILRHFGNHPSFVMFALGNENRGNRDVMASLVKELRAIDARRLYAQGSNATASSYEHSWQNFTPSQAIDSNDFTAWRSEQRRSPRVDGGNFGAQAAGPAAQGDAGRNDAPEQWWQVTFDASHALTAGEIIWGDDKPGYAYLVEGSTDGSSWTTLSDQRSNAFTTARHSFSIDGGAAVRAVRVRITALPQEVRASIREVRFFDAR